MSETYTVDAVTYKGKKPNPHGGVLHKFSVALTDESGTQHRDVYWQRKSERLSEGDEFYGHIEDGEYGPRFKTDQRPTGPQPFKAPSYQRENGDERSRRIERQHSQEMGIRAVALLTPQGTVDSADALRTSIQHWTNWFQQDLDADVGGEERPSHSPAADMSAEASPQLKGKATQLLNKAGLAEGARKAVILFRCGTLKNPPKGRVQSLVTDLEQGATAEALLAEISDAWGNGDEVAAEAVKLIPPGAPVDTEGLPELDAEGKQILGIKDESDVPF